MNEKANTKSLELFFDNNTYDVLYNPDTYEIKNIENIPITYLSDEDYITALDIGISQNALDEEEKNSVLEKYPTFDSLLMSGNKHQIQEILFLAGEEDLTQTEYRTYLEINRFPQIIIDKICEINLAELYSEAKDYISRDLVSDLQSYFGDKYTEQGFIQLRLADHTANVSNSYKTRQPKTLDVRVVEEDRTYDKFMGGYAGTLDVRGMSKSEVISAIKERLFSMNQEVAQDYINNPKKFFSYTEGQTSEEVLLSLDNNEYLSHEYKQRLKSMIKSIPVKENLAKPIFLNGRLREVGTTFSLIPFDEKKDHLINKSPNLTPEEKQEVINFFNINPNREGEINWNNLKGLTYDDFKQVMNKSTKSGLKKSVRKLGITGLVEGRDYQTVFENDKVQAVVPFTHNTSQLIASNKVANCEGKWCTAANLDKHWKSYTKKGVVLVYWIKEASKYATAFYPNGTDSESFTQENTTIHTQDLLEYIDLDTTPQVFNEVKEKALALKDKIVSGATPRPSNRSEAERFIEKTDRRIYIKYLWDGSPISLDGYPSTIIYHRYDETIVITWEEGSEYIHSEDTPSFLSKSYLHRGNGLEYKEEHEGSEGTDPTAISHYSDDTIKVEYSRHPQDISIAQLRNEDEMQINYNEMRDNETKTINVYSKETSTFDNHGNRLSRKPMTTEEGQFFREFIENNSNELDPYSFLDETDKQEIENFKKGAE